MKAGSIGTVNAYSIGYILRSQEGVLAGELRYKAEGERLRRQIMAAGLTQVQFAEKVGAHKDTVQDWVKGRSKPTGVYASKVAEVLPIEGSGERTGSGSTTDLHPVLERPSEAELRRVALWLMALADQVAQRGGSSTSGFGSAPRAARLSEPAPPLDQERAGQG